MKRFLWVIVAFLMLFPACQELATDEIYKEDGVTVLTVELPSAEKPRTELGEKVDGNYPVYWSEGDQVSANGEAVCFERLQLAELMALAPNA